MDPTKKLLSGSSNTTTQPPLKFPKLTEDDPTRTKIRSLPNEAISFIIDELRCKILCQDTFSADKIPHIICCGHYVHNYCLYDKDNETIRTGCSCVDFKKYDLNDRNSKRRDQVLGDIFTALAKDGYRCNDCKELHPQFNSVYWEEYANAENSSPYYCVWCAANKVEHIRKEFRLIKKGDEPSGEKNATEQLRSLDYTKMELLNQWMLCCHCLKLLVDENVQGYPKCVFMNCGHICHETHIKKGELFCHFPYCRAPNIIGEEVCHIKEYQGAGGKKMKYLYCYNCGERHAESNSTSTEDEFVCVWCTVEENDKKRVDGLKKGSNIRRS